MGAFSRNWVDTLRNTAPDSPGADGAEYSGFARGWEILGHTDSHLWYSLLVPEVQWNQEKAELLRIKCGVSSDDIVPQIEQGDVLDDLEHPNQERYPGQRIFVVNIQGYAYVIPYVENEAGIFLKTIYPSRKATRYYL